MIKVTFEFDTAEAAAAFLMDDVRQVANEVVAGEQAKRGRGRPAKVAAADTARSGEGSAPAATPAAAPAASIAAPSPAAPAAVAPAATAVPFAALVDPLTKLADTDLEKAMGILGKYGVKRANELKPEQFGPFLAEVNAALNPPAAARPSLI